MKKRPYRGKSRRAAQSKNKNAGRRKKDISQEGGPPSLVKYQGQKRNLSCDEKREGVYESHSGEKIPS